MRVLVIDDEENICNVIKLALERDGIEVISFTSPKKAVSILNDYKPDIVITDIRMDDMSGFDVLREVKKFNREVNVILITAFASVDTAVEAIREGAFDYVIKPFKLDDIRIAVKRAYSERRISLSDDGVFEKEIVGKSAVVKEILDIVDKVAVTDSTVLITGESGTGKELIARRIHKLSNRSDAPFVSLNCAALPAELLESELFGYEKGSFTGANNTKLGLFEYADGGTLFLDEIGDLMMQLQVKILRAIQEREIRRIGSFRDIPVDVRIIAATSKDIESAVDKNQFRKDLYYRLNIVSIVMPPLRERREDIPVLIEYFLKKNNDKFGKSVSFDSSAVMLLSCYAWPGNIRELENVVEKIVVLSDSGILSKDDVMRYYGFDNGKKNRDGSELLIKGRKKSFSKNEILSALEKAGMKKVKAAELLGISKQSLQYYINKYDLK